MPPSLRFIHIQSTANHPLSRMIQVSILELAGLPSLLQSSSMGIKVSLGKEAHEAQYKGEFSFPLASFRDNLLVSVHDSEGNEIANTGVETRLIVEKGIWDDLFPLKGGGTVHMRLHFILTEDEQKRIRLMRESATKKKQEDLFKRSHSSSELAVPSGGSPATSQDSLKNARQTDEGNVNPTVSQAKNTSAESGVRAFSKVHLVQKKQVLSSSKSTSALDKLPVYQHAKEVIQLRDHEKQSSLDKTPSNVRKMVLAFENSPVKEVLPTNETRSTTQLSGSTTMEFRSSKKTVAVNSKPVFSNSKTVQSPSTPARIVEEKGEIAQKIDQISREKNISKMQPDRAENKAEQKSPRNLAISSTSEQSTFSYTKLVRSFPNRKRYAAAIFTEQQRSTFRDRFVLERRWRSKHWTSSLDREKSKSSYGNECYSSDRPHSWIFLDEMKCSCIASDVKPLIDQLEGCPSIVGSPYQEKPHDFQLADCDVTQSEDKKSFVPLKESESGKGANSRASIRPTVQAMKIAIMVGFGLLVFLTRQKKLR